MDLTPWVGIIGAVVGGSIGIVGQRMNIREQRRKDLRERVVEFLRAADELNSVASSLKTIGHKAGPDRVREILSKITSMSIEMDHRKQYLDLTAPFVLRFWVGQLHTAAEGLCSIALERVESSGDNKAPEIIEAIESSFWVARGTFDELRANLVHYMRPDIDDVPLWVKKPWPKVWMFLLRPLIRKPKTKSNAPVATEIAPPTPNEPPV